MDVGLKFNLNQISLQRKLTCREMEVYIFHFGTAFDTLYWKDKVKLIILPIHVLSLKKVTMSMSVPIIFQSSLLSFLALTLFHDVYYKLEEQHFIFS